MKMIMMIYHSFSTFNLNLTILSTYLFFFIITLLIPFPHYAIRSFSILPKLFTIKKAHFSSSKWITRKLHPRIHLRLPWLMKIMFGSTLFFHPYIHPSFFYSRWKKKIIFFFKKQIFLFYLRMLLASRILFHYLYLNATSINSTCLGCVYILCVYWFG